MCKDVNIHKQQKHSKVEFANLPQGNFKPYYLLIVDCYTQLPTEIHFLLVFQLPLLETYHKGFLA